MSSSSSFSEEVYPDQLYTETQSRVLVNVPRLSGFLSVLGSSVILFIIWKDRKRKLTRVYHRLLMGYSVLDIFCSINYALSSLVVPKGTPGVWGAAGSIATCEASGFVNQFSFSLAVYGTFICVYYVLVLRYQVREKVLATRVEPVVHIIALSIPLGVGIIMIRKDMYNPGNYVVGWCFLNCYPMNCLRNNDIECERGGNYKGWLLLHMIPFVCCLAIVILSSVLTFMTVLKTENRGARWSISTRQSRIRVRETATQAFLYIAAFLMTHVWSGIGVVGLLGPGPATEENRTWYFAMGLMIKMFLPLQGFWNLFIYVRPRFNTIRRKRPDLPWYSILYAVVNGENATTREDISGSIRRRQSSRSWNSSMIPSFRSPRTPSSNESTTNARLPSSEESRAVPHNISDEESLQDEDDYMPELERTRSLQGGLTASKAPSKLEGMIDLMVMSHRSSEANQSETFNIAMLESQLQKERRNNEDKANDQTETEIPESDSFTKNSMNAP